MTTELQTVDVQNGSLSNETFHQFLSSGSGPAAIIGHRSVSPPDVAALPLSDAAVTVYVIDAAAGTEGRFAADLTATLWQTFPTIAALLSHALPCVGGIVFSGDARQSLAATIGSDREATVSLAIATLIRTGGQVRAVLVPETTVAGPVPDPPVLSPRRPLSHGRSLSNFFTSASESLFPVHQSTPDVAAVFAGLLISQDALDEGHEWCQSVEGEGRSRSADYWHAIMHRRESDFGNSKYWFRRVGHHPVFDSLAARADRLLSTSGRSVDPLLTGLTDGGSWNPGAFVAACQAAASKPPEFDLLLRRIQADEMMLLLLQTCQDAFDR